MPARVATIEYDPNRSARIALLHYFDGEKRYILAPVGLKVGDQVQTAERAEIEPGNVLPLRTIPLGTVLHNIELKPGKGGQMCRAAGSSGSRQRGTEATLRSRSSAGADELQPLKLEPSGLPHCSHPPAAP